MAKKIDPKWAALWESLKEPFRIALLALVSWLLTVIIPQIPVIWVPIITLILKFVDEYLHQLGKATDNETLITGLTRF
jgi:hypothetical protein